MVFAMLKTYLVFCVAAFVCVATLPPQPHADSTSAPLELSTRHVTLLGSKECSWGPSYWCSNLTAAAGCRATKHCIQTVWAHKTYPDDGDSICQTCLDMVKQARDQLESNETQEEIKEVFEGSCNLIPIKVVSKECCKLADDFIPDLIDTLASQMNPQTVCSVAGLCNNIKYDKLLEGTAEDVIAKQDADLDMDTCQGCHHVMDIMEKKFVGTSRDDFLQRLLQICARMGSFSDGCSNIVITYFNDIYAHMQREFKADKVCLLSGECSINFHTHPEIEVTPMGHVGFVSVGDDPACKLCKQLVNHLRDLLIADTTETEFQKVLQGLCKQTGNFKDECLGIVNQYYPIIYKYLVEELNSTVVCDFADICPGPGFEQFEIAPIAPLLSVETAEKAKQLTQAPKQTSIKFEEQAPEQMQLPIERLNSPFVNNVYNKEMCTFCQYFLHYVQQAITDPKTESQMKKIVDEACDHLPNSVSETCEQFVNSYGDALVAILAEEIDPATICPLIRVCPSSSDNHDIEVFMQTTPEDKPNCPLCLFAVTKLEEMVRDHKTKESIKDALNSLCSHLNDNLRKECQDFVDGYTDELVEMLVDDFKPQEICVYLKICKDDRAPHKFGSHVYEGSISTNEIPDHTANGRPVYNKQQVSNKPSCPLCEFVMAQLQNMLKDKKTEEEIEQAVHSVCSVLPKTLHKECDGFVDQYGDMVIQLLISSVEPKEICTMINLCDKVTAPMTLSGSKPLAVRVIEPRPVSGGPTCFLCKQVIRALESVIGSVTEDELESTIKGMCSILPRNTERQCDDFIDRYGDAMYDFLKEGFQPSELCSLLYMCDQNPLVKAVKDSVYTCAVCEATVGLVDDILANPNLIHRAEHVLEKACVALPNKHIPKCHSLIETYGDKIFHYVATIGSEKACKEIGICGRKVAHTLRKRELLGANKCTWGPGYWCKSLSNAQECGDGAHAHCKTKVWMGEKPANEM